MADGLVQDGGEAAYRIAHVDRMPPFLMSIVSDSDHWMYVSSRGGLTAGRIDADRALLPYVTDDQLHDCHWHTGPATLVRVAGRSGPVLWEPFRADAPGAAVARHLSKALIGNQVTFEEVNAALGLALRYRWAPSPAFGFVRTVTVENRGSAPVALEILDGLLNLMPAGATLAQQQRTSCLVNAYTRAEVDPQTSMGIVALQSLIVDQPRPAESLKATVVYLAGLAPAAVLLSADALRAFRRGEPLETQPELKGRRAAYLACVRLELEPGEARSWDLVADVDRSHVQVEALRAMLLQGGVRERIAADLERASEGLRRRVAGADGLQKTAEPLANAHHFANALFNAMRGGVFAQNHQVSWGDFLAFLQERDRAAGRRWGAELAPRPGTSPLSSFLEWAKEKGDPDLARHALEYLPLTYSRRHGDPSRPWNAFSIQTRRADGSPALDYQGNWRDIFQNWEALGASFPEFLEGFIARFVNASTADGFNPYRINRESFDWEVPEPDEPWSAIGYWGDHQIVYLTRLLEASMRFHPGRLAEMLAEPWFCYADVPYRLKSYREIAANPSASIEFDASRDRTLRKRAEALGTDGKLLRDGRGALVRATLAEKLLVPVLSKVCNLVLDGGIWMNTQRPEWNDANNALAGRGLSVVTLCALRRHLAVLLELFESSKARAALISLEVQRWLADVEAALGEREAPPAVEGAGDVGRRALLDALQRAFETYRVSLYVEGLTPGGRLDFDRAAGFFRRALALVDRGIRANRRPDGLYHAYNLLELVDAPSPQASIARLDEMLEGQVAALSSGVLTGAESLAAVEALFASRLFRPDQQSFMLYPDRALPGFLAKNIIPPEEVKASPLLSALLEAGESILIARDAFGAVRFDGALHSPADVRAAVERLAQAGPLAPLARQLGEGAAAAFARVFALERFTGRSGAMYGYEGLGCIYWHMVGKLLLAVQEIHRRSRRDGSPPEVVEGLARMYERVRAGLGFNKTAREYGAFPFDPYSHTPRHAGAQQPGMTGQVKEEILARLGELGVEVAGGCLELRPALLSRREFLEAPARWALFDLGGRPATLELEAGELGFTLCGTPVIYRLGAEPKVAVRLASGAERMTAGARLDVETTRAVFAREGGVERIEVEVDAAGLRP